MQLDFFGGDVPDGPANPLPKPARVDRWRLVDHACRHCFGRLLTSGSGKTASVHCAQCGRHEDGPVESLCACGVHTAGGRQVLECYRNPERTLEVPHEVLVRVRELEEAGDPAPGARKVSVPGF
ncbi:hypothetical protein [Burkholderia sp. Ac-20349]|uniref:hypothetical protein n=1 Tax=Burkholderia sp. Ac-20349 TaxID=2703893 RepID=UPI00197B30D5|nr:hypothetical protein [Burkholderia sp. Ac-20349]MBN3839234.1 hypothetical protein [Burkholderia sp. Ac-20349]